MPLEHLFEYSDDGGGRTVKDGVRQMNGLRAWLDKKREGTHYSDRMSRILNVCQDCGVLWHEERISYRNGQSEVRRIDDIEPAHDVLVTPQYEKYGLRVNPRVLPRLRTMSAQFAYALNVPGTSVEVDGNIVYIRVPRPREGDDITVLFEEAWGMAPDIPRGNLLLGVDEEHHQLVLDLVAPTNVHAAVVGMTGSGKSNLMRAMILSAQKSVARGGAVRPQQRLSGSFGASLRVAWRPVPHRRRMRAGVGGAGAFHGTRVLAADLCLSTKCPTWWRNGRASKSIWRDWPRRDAMPIST